MIAYVGGLRLLIFEHEKAGEHIQRDPAFVLSITFVSKRDGDCQSAALIICRDGAAHPLCQRPDNGKPQS